jgi:hypothetical protein
MILYFSSMFFSHAAKPRTGSLSFDTVSNQLSSDHREAPNCNESALVF